MLKGFIEIHRELNPAESGGAPFFEEFILNIRSISNIERVEKSDRALIRLKSFINSNSYFKTKETYDELKRLIDENSPD